MIEEHEFFGDGGIYCCVKIGPLGELCGQHYAAHGLLWIPTLRDELDTLAKEAGDLLEDGDDLDPDRSRYLIERLARFLSPGEAAKRGEFLGELQRERERLDFLARTRTCLLWWDCKDTAGRELGPPGWVLTEDIGIERAPTHFDIREAIDLEMLRWEESAAACTKCGHRWRAYHPIGAHTLECPACDALASIRSRA